MTNFNRRLRPTTMYTNIKQWFIGDYINTVDDLHEKSRIGLMFDFAFQSGVVLAVMSVLFQFIGVPHSVIPVTIGWSFCFILIFVLKYINRVRLVAFLFCSCAFSVLTINLFANDDTAHLGYPFWISVLIMIGAFINGMVFAIPYAILGGTAFFYYRQYHLIEGVHHEIIDPTSRSGQTLVELIVTIGLMLYVIYTYVWTSKRSEEQLIAKNQRLEKQNKLIHEQSEEKTTMLKEIHHRVKNNLQLVNSMLKLQSINLTDEKSLEVFELSRNRIMAMSLVHERLYMLDKMEDEINPKYFPDFVEDLIKLYSNNQDVETNIKFEDGFLKQENIIPFGLILNELISNSLKHGIKGKGKIIAQGFLEGERYKFIYGDNGTGLPPEIEKSFGMELIESLTDQLDGVLDIEHQSYPGSKFNFCFKCAL